MSAPLELPLIRLGTTTDRAEAIDRIDRATRVYAEARRAGLSVAAAYEAVCRELSEEC